MSQLRYIETVASAALIALIVGSTNANAFKIGSAFSDPCHESITLKGFFGNDNLEGGQILLPAGIYDGAAANQSATWLQIAQYLETQLDYTFQSDFERFLGITLFIGVRYPDQANFAITDINNLRDIHLAVEGQEEHALRAVGHDFDPGNEEAVIEIRKYIREVVDEAYEAFQGSRPAGGAAITQSSLKRQTVRVGFWLDFYGTVDVEVWRPLFLMGKAAHAIQDSFAHTYRSGDTGTIYAVGNFVEAMSTEYSESRDGPRHSDKIDDCTDPQVLPLVSSAIGATRSLFFAFRDYLAAPLNDAAAVQAASDHIDLVIAQSTAFQDDCGFENNYCETPWVALAREAETMPLLGCVSSNATTWLLTLSGLIGIRWYLRRRQIETGKNEA